MTIVVATSLHPQIVVDIRVRQRSLDEGDAAMMIESRSVVVRGAPPRPGVVVVVSGEVQGGISIDVVDPGWMDDVSGGRGCWMTE
jgi:hypothetical protein